MERKLIKCNYCKHEWFGRKPNVCPKCHNPVGKKPKNKSKYKMEKK